MYTVPIKEDYSLDVKCTCGFEPNLHKYALQLKFLILQVRINNSHRIYTELQSMKSPNITNASDKSKRVHDKL